MTALVALVRLVMFKLVPALPGAVDLVLGIALTVGWVFGAGFNTASNGIFVVTDNGYFRCGGGGGA